MFEIYGNPLTWNIQFSKLIQSKYIEVKNHKQQTVLFSLVHHFLKICKESPPCNIPGVAKTTIGSGRSMNFLSKGCPYKIIILAFGWTSSLCNIVTWLISDHQLQRRSQEDFGGFVRNTCGHLQLELV